MIGAEKDGSCWEQAFEEAEKIVEHFIPDKSQCSEENDKMFVAASTLYQVTGRKKEKKGCG